MQLRTPTCLGTFGLLAVLLTQMASGEQFDAIFRPVAFEELVAPDNTPEDIELPPPPEPVDPGAANESESVLEPAPEVDEAVPYSPYDEPPYGAAYPGADFLPWNAPVGGGTWLNEPDGHPLHSGHHLGIDACCERPRIKYWNHPLLASDRCRCHSTATTTVLLTVPSDCCSVQVPVCVSACCDAVPGCETGRDLLGRTTYEYCWPCGQRVKIVQRHTGTLVVHTFRSE